MRTPEWLRSYLSFSKKDRLGTILILFLIGLMYLLPLVFPNDHLPFPLTAETLDVLEDSLLKKPDTPVSFPKNNEQPHLNFSKKLFAFDPNTLDAEGWLRLGLPQRNVRTLLNYRNKGGKFRRPDDLKKIWGLPPDFYAQVKDSIRIPTATRASLPRPSELYSSTTQRKRLAPIEINTADSSAWIALPGIGSRLAARILLFREKLGGFYSIDQVSETYGLADSVFQRLRAFLSLDTKPKLIDINTASEQQLRQHPYIRWQLAKIILAYRAAHGGFRELSDMEKLGALEPGQLEKLAPYLSFR